MFIFFFLASAAAIQIPFIQNVTFAPASSSSSITLINRTCDQCLCESNSSHTIINCFSNASCQLFDAIPRTYTLQPTTDTRVYFPQGIIPNASQISMPNTSLLLEKLNTATPIYGEVRSPRCLLLDSNGYLVTVSYSDKTIVRFYPNNLTQISTPASPNFTENPYSIAYSSGAYYVGFINCILVILSSNMTQLHSISNSGLFNTRDIMFINNGQTMIVASVDNNRLLFFNQSSAGSYNYDYVSYQDLGCPNPHGLFYLNDSFFYATSWSSNKLYSYSNAGNTTSWTEMFLMNTLPNSSTSAGAHVSMDESGRLWVSLGSFRLRIFSGQGAELGILNLMGTDVFDVLILDNYVMFVSGLVSNRITRIDPNL